jgi:archaemetzincin
MGMTMRDLGVKIFTFVFGQARRNGFAALVSLARLRPEFYGLPSDPDLTSRRAVAEILHELGHILGLMHCTDFTCIMHFATNVETIDLRGDDFCPKCVATLPPDFLIRNQQQPINRNEE